jgi:hypothetical protein
VAPTAALELNPLPVGFGKVGGNLEFVLAAHHALIFCPAYFAATAFHGPEGEAGYRFYFSPRTLSGPFLGVGIMGAAFSYLHEASDCPQGQVCLTRFDSTRLYGATVEFGTQWIVKDWFLLGVGGGFIFQHATRRQYELYGDDFSNQAEWVLDSGVRPRVLFSVGVVL